MRAFLRALALAGLMMLLAAGAAAAEERHTVVFPCQGGGPAGIRETGDMAWIRLEMPEEAATADAQGDKWTPELKAMPGFQLLGASLRFTVTKVEGLDLSYALRCGARLSYPQPVRAGRNLWDVTAPVKAFLEAPETGLQIIPFYQLAGWGMQVKEGSVSLQLTFATDDPEPGFPMDRVQSSPVFDYSLSMLEADSPFIARYNETTESLLEASLPLGVPYYYAGGSEDKFLRRFFPDTNTAYYQPDHMYLCGLDCVGMTRLVYEKCGLERHPSISDLLFRGVGHHALKSNDPGRWHMLLQPGELIAVKHGTFHIMIYLGTLRQFGWTEKSAGEAAPLLDAPLVIHCGGNPFCYDRYEEYIREKGYRNTMPPDGGVTVSVIQKTAGNAPHSRDTFWGKHFGWYMLGQDPLLVFPLDDCTDIAWYGPEGGAPGRAE